MSRHALPPRRSRWSWRELLPAVFAVLFISALAIALFLFALGKAHADPVCDGPGLPPCAGPGTPQEQCAAIAWRTWTPCNWYGIKVPQGTPGSWG